MIDINQDEISQKNSRVPPLWSQKQWRKIFVELKVEPDEKTKKLQMKFVTTCNKNEQQKDGKNNAELKTEWKKMTWKTFEETIRRGRNRSIKT
jgi:hypothetical protein